MSVSTPLPTSSTCPRGGCACPAAKSPVLVIFAATGIWSLLAFSHWFLVPSWREAATDFGVALPKIAVLVFQLNQWLHAAGLVSVFAILLSMGTLIVGVSMGRLAPRVAGFIMGFWGTVGFGLLAAVAFAYFSLWQASARL